MASTLAPPVFTNVPVSSLDANKSSQNGFTEDRMDAFLQRMDKMIALNERSSVTIYQRRYITGIYLFSDRKCTACILLATVCLSYRSVRTKKCDFQSKAGSRRCRQTFHEFIPFLSRSWHCQPRPHRSVCLCVGNRILHDNSGAFLLASSSKI